MAEVNYRISEETRRNTTKCPNDMFCLVEGKCSDCVIEWVVKGTGMFVKTNQSNSCYYKKIYADRHICKCPTRYELHMRYGI